MEPIKAALIGAGQRGMLSYAPYAIDHPNEVQFVAVAEPDAYRRKEFARIHQIDEDMQFESWEEMLNKPQLCQAILICTVDNQHHEPAIKAIESGYDIMLEKPMSNSAQTCVHIAEAAKAHNAKMIICHVMRYTNFYQAIKKVLDEGRIGDIVSVQHNENIGYWHFAHSYVRGNWRRNDESTPLILSKSCHDLDMLNYLIGKKCLSVSSYGSLKHFKKKNAPQGSTMRCTDGCAVENECPYSALKIYKAEPEWPATVMTNDYSPEGVINALKTGPYGRCVYQCDNDVVDHQVVNMAYEDDITVSFNLSAFTEYGIGRTLKIMGTMGQIRACSGLTEIEIQDYRTGQVDTIRTQAGGGHGGGDIGIMRDFVQVCRGKEIKPENTIDFSLSSHIVGFAADKSRIEGKTIDIAEFYESHKK